MQYSVVLTVTGNFLLVFYVWGLLSRFLCPIGGGQLSCLGEYLPYMASAVNSRSTRSQAATLITETFTTRSQHSHRAGRYLQRLTHAQVHANVAHQERKDCSYTGLHTIARFKHWLPVILLRQTLILKWMYTVSQKKGPPVNSL